MADLTHPIRQKSANGEPDISTRRLAPSGKVHGMADRGTKTMCGLDLPEPWTWTEESVSCQRCEVLVKMAEDRERQSEECYDGEGQ